MRDGRKYSRWVGIINCDWLSFRKIFLIFVYGFGFSCGVVCCLRMGMACECCDGNNRILKFKGPTIALSFSFSATL